MENRVAIEFANKLNKTFARRIGKRLYQIILLMGFIFYFQIHGIKENI